MDKEERTTYQKTFGYGYEDLKTNIYEMAQNMHEPMAAMGIDTPLAVLSLKEQPLFNYFKQLFAQVTNPPIDAIREEIVTIPVMVDTLYLVCGKRHPFAEKKIVKL